MIYLHILKENVLLEATVSHQSLLILMVQMNVKTCRRRRRRYAKENMPSIIM